MNISEESKFFEHLSRESITTKAGIHLFPGNNYLELVNGSLGSCSACMYLQHLVFILGSLLKGFGFVGIQG